MTFGHIVLEGYCDLDEDTKEIFPCYLEGRAGMVGHYCIIEEGRTICKHLGWCKAANMEIITDEEGYDIDCKTRI